MIQRPERGRQRNRLPQVAIRGAQGSSGGSESEYEAPISPEYHIGSSIGSQLGALTTNVLPNRILRLLFAGLVAATVVMIGGDLIGLLLGKAK